MRYSRTTGGALAVGMAAALIGLAPPAYAGDEHVVRPGESIQAAIDKADPGDTIRLRAGTYRENVDIVTDRITVRGAGTGKTIIEPPATLADSPCNVPDDTGAVVSAAGICVGDFAYGPDPEAPPTVNDVVEKTVIRDLTVRGFGNGAFLLGTDRAEITRSEFVDNGEYGFYANTSTRGHFHRNVARGSEVSGIYIGDSPDSGVRLERNEVRDNLFGIFIRDAEDGVASRNDVRGNCFGMFLLDTGAPTVPSGWDVERNRVVDNTRVCAGEEGGAPPLSGAGIVLAGASDNLVRRNEVIGNVPGGPSPLAAGGIVLVPTTDFGGGIPTGNRIERNRLDGNEPVDIADRGADNEYSRNDCDTSEPATICS